jgi:hypothetical protein
MTGWVGGWGGWARQLIDARYKLNPERCDTLQKVVQAEKEDKVTTSDNATVSMLWFKRYAESERKRERERPHHAHTH